MKTKLDAIKKLISITLVFSTLVGCGVETEEQTIGDKDTVTLDWYINYSWFNTRWGSNVVSRTITENTGVNINFITPQGNEEEKLNALIESGS